MFGNPLHIFGVFFVVAMPMVHPFISDIVLASECNRNDMVRFEDVAIVKVESTAWALPFLDDKKFCLLVSH